MNYSIHNISQLEKEYGHTELYSGVNGEKEVQSKLEVFCRTLALIGKNGDKSLADMASKSMAELINAHALSPECAAYILFQSFPEDREKYIFLASLYKNRSPEDYAVFQAIYFAQKYEKVNYELHVLVRQNHDDKLNKVMEGWWNEIMTRSNRDQLSLGYICWKQG